MYRPEEHKLFAFFGLNHLSHLFTPYEMYRKCVIEAFVHEYTGIEVEILRKMYKNVDTFGNTFRTTPEFEQLLEPLSARIERLNWHQNGF